MMNGNADDGVFDDPVLQTFHVYRHLRRITRSIEVYREGIARNYGISGPALYLFWGIYSLPQCSYKELASYLGLPPNTVSSTLRGLIEQSLVRSTTDKLDHRITRLSISERGEQVVKDVWTLTHTESNLQYTSQGLQTWFEQMRQMATDSVFNRYV